MAQTCGPSCAGNGLECAIKHTGIAEVYCEEAATRADFEDCRKRIQNAYDHMSHVSDVHLASSHPKLAKQARHIRKQWENIVFKRTKACPPKGACEEIGHFKQELVNELAKFEGHDRDVAQLQDFSDIIVNDVTVNNDSFSPWLGAAVALAVSLVIVPYVFRKP